MLSAQDILAAGYTGKRVGELIKWSKSWTKEEITQFLTDGTLPDYEKVVVQPNSTLDWFVNNHCVSTLLNSSIAQKRRWLNEGAVIMNGQKVMADEKMVQLTSLVFFPNGRTITML